MGGSASSFNPTTAMQSLTPEQWTTINGLSGSEKAYDLAKKYNINWPSDWGRGDDDDDDDDGRHKSSSYSSMSISDLAKKYNLQWPLQQPAPRQFTWQFPQYSQTWAFTPPTPQPVNLPPMFDPKTYGKDTKKKDDD
jgi:hypothetical protein